MFKKSRISQALLVAFGGSVALGAFHGAAQAQQRVEITGSSIKRLEAEGALPVQTLTRVDIERTGVQTTEQLLQTVSAISAAGATLTSTGAGLGTYGFSGLSLRGLGQERTLVLVNGRRMATFADGSGAVNVNNIPLSAVEKVEILKDGASAIYGSDAVAGVVNFILVKNFTGIEIGGTYGTPTTSGGGQQYQAHVVAGFGDVNQDRFNVTVSGQYSRNKELFAKDRDFAKTGNKPPFFESGATGQGNIQGAWQLGTGPVDLPGAAYRGTSGSAYGNPFATPTNRCGDINMALAPSLSSGGQPFCNFDASAFVGLLGETENASFTGNFVFKLTADTELFGDVLYSKTTTISTIQPSPLRTSFLATDELFDADPATGRPATDRVLLFRATNPNYNIASDYLNANGLSQLVGQDLGITARVFDFGPRTSEDESTQTRLVGGVRGSIFDQSYVVAAAYNENKLSGSVTDGYFSQLGFAQATQAPGSDWNPWSLTQSAAFQSAIAPAKYVGPTLSGKSTAVTLDATLSGDVVALPAGTMQYAAGYQYTKDEVETTPSPAQLTGDIAGLGGATKPINADRNVNAVFGELNIPVIKNLDLNLALRYDDYSDFGSTTNYKANVRWQPMQQLLVRGSLGTGFRAPTLNDLFEPIVLATSSQFDDPITGQSDLQVNDRSGGNPNLQPEESNQYSVGLVFQPIAPLSIGLDYFNIEVKSVISQPSTQEIVSQNAAGNPAYAGLVIRNPITNEIIETFTTKANTGTLKASGIDLDLRYRDKVGPGNLGVVLNGTYYLKYDQSTPGATSQKIGTIVNPDGSPVISSTTGLDGYGVIIRYKQYAAATYAQGPWAFTVGNTYTTGYYGGFDLNGDPTRVGALSLWDLSVNWTAIKNVSLTLGARNVFDTEQDTFVSVSNQFQAGYDAQQFDPRGRFVYLTGTFKF